MKFLRTLIQSLRSEAHDFTQGDIGEAVILLAVPMILELSLEGVFAVVDMFFVSRLGPSAIATVGLTESVATLIYSVAIGLSTGATAIVARRIGEKNPEGAAHTGAQALILSFLCSILLSIIGLVYAEKILSFMGAAPEIVRDGAIFTRILIGGSPAIVLLFLINGIFRGAGDAAIAMRSLWIASGTNILLCPFFIHLFGLKGAALATLVGRSSGVVYQTYRLFKGDGVMKFRLEHFGFDLPIVKSLAKIAWPASLQFIIGSGSWIVLTRLVAETGGTDASAGYQIAFRNFVFFILPAWGLSNAAATLAGQNLGAKHFDRAEESVITTAKYSATLMAFVTLFFLLFASPLVNIFTNDLGVAGYGTEALRILGLGFVFYGMGMVLTQALNGAGDTKTPTRINVICFWIFQVPVAYFLAKHTSLGAHGVVYVIPASHALLVVLAWRVFRRGEWKAVPL